LCSSNSSREKAEEDEELIVIAVTKTIQGWRHADRKTLTVAYSVQRIGE
jgi:hypothetical protein